MENIDKKRDLLEEATADEAWAEMVQKAAGRIALASSVLVVTLLCFVDAFVDDTRLKLSPQCLSGVIGLGALLLSVPVLLSAGNAVKYAVALTTFKKGKLFSLSSIITVLTTAIVSGAMVIAFSQLLAK